MRVERLEVVDFRNHDRAAIDLPGGASVLVGPNGVGKTNLLEAIGYHHDDYAGGSLWPVLISAADAISGARPGARRESLEIYIKRLEALEKIANAFPGVEKSFAIQAGREIRIIVKPEEVDDLGASRMAKEISRRIQESLDYPGQVKVTVIRERRSVEYAK